MAGKLTSTLSFIMSKFSCLHGSIAVIVIPDHVSYLAVYIELWKRRKTLQTAFSLRIRMPIGFLADSAWDGGTAYLSNSLTICPTAGFKVRANLRQRWI
jgi:hypothetical protein